jgi:hypothetical protein
MVSMMTIGSSVPAEPRIAAAPNPVAVAAYPVAVEAFPAAVEAVHRAVPIPAAVSVHRPA